MHYRVQQLSFVRVGEYYTTKFAPVKFAGGQKNFVAKIFNNLLQSDGPGLDDLACRFVSIQHVTAQLAKYVDNEGFPDRDRSCQPNF